MLWRKSSTHFHLTWPATLRPSGFGWHATRRPKGIGCLPKLRRSEGRLPQPRVGSTLGLHGVGCRRVVRLLSRAEERRRIRRIDGRSSASVCVSPEGPSRVDALLPAGRPSLLCRRQRRTECASSRTAFQVGLGQSVRQEAILRRHSRCPRRPGHGRPGEKSQILRLCTVGGASTKRAATHLREQP